MRLRALGLALLLSLVPASGVAQGPCSAKCDAAASSCDDACERQHPDDAKARIACKLACISQRETCDKRCK
jgi:hypothetical protein